ncbi:MAG TPA: hypothetical protein VEL79_22350 [Vicinamibacterales bacterium]|nr:hypothetical protein [Vicinamibacterales bacterium]
MINRSLITCFAVLTLAAGRAEAVTIHDVIELSKAGLSDQVLVALIEVDRSVFSIDAATLKQLKNGGVSDAVIIAMIRSGRTPPAVEPVPPPPQTAVTEPEPMASEPPIDVMDTRDMPPPPVAYPVPVAVPVFVPVPAQRFTRQNRIPTTIETDIGVVKARVPLPPNCVKAEPVYWGFGGKLRPGSWEPPTTVVCR